VGNRTTGGSVVNAGNQLTADANYTYQYDDNGNLTRKTLLATENFTQYTYDAENRLTKVEDFVAGTPTPAFTSTYRYDGLGRRIEKMANGQTRRNIYDGEDILLEAGVQRIARTLQCQLYVLDQCVLWNRHQTTLYCSLPQKLR
jgi:YD repeat-containing protein